MTEPSLPSTDTVAFGGFLAKLSSPDPHSAITSAVDWWPAARTGRSAKMIELGVTPVMVSVSPWSVAPRELSTNSEGTISGLAGPEGVPIVFMGDDDGAAPVV